MGSVLCDPYFGVAAGHRDGAQLVADPGHVEAAPLADDVAVTPEAGPYELRVAFNRPSLTRNPMWAGRIDASISALTPTPAHIEVEVVDDPAAIGDRVVDHRGHHLGVDRATVKPR